MANVFGILTAILLALSAFIAHKNKQAYEKSIADTATAKRNLATSTDRYNLAVKNVNDTSNELDETVAETQRLNEESDTRRSRNQDLTLQLETKTATAKSNLENLEEARAKAAQISNRRELAGQMRQVRAEIEDFTQLISAAEVRLANLTADNNQADSQANALRTKLDTLTSGRSLPTLDTRIRTIYPNWGFVTLAAGNNSGVVTNSTLNVMRGGQIIARLLVTAVESNTASASIVPDSLAEDTVLMVGDRVVAGGGGDALD